MRACFLKLQLQVSQLSVMGVTDIPRSATKHINDFAEHQGCQAEAFRANLEEFRALVVKQVCKMNDGLLRFWFV